MTVSTTDKQQKPLLGKLQFKSVILVETGLHIGGGGENLNIGGLDKPIIRDPLTQYPYLPGTSIKGKLRSILERERCKSTRSLCSVFRYRCKNSFGNG